MPQPQPDPRRAQRFGLALPITMEGTTDAFTHDISPDGILFEAESPPELGAVVSLQLSYRVGTRDFGLVREGKVVRVERHGDNYNVAVRLSRPLFE
jgi:hypothetical protein